ncbi:hypothetical protein [Lactobacillus kefiranofaciens]|uniref:Uncharacterized protein n=1 Tax=Lactobacillus kefiranofaciens TaxID=267818 RepID=A0AAX3UFZ7_9LACO|nr:hypothetical protein [Lactobacillus kefiranofaciens]MCJ2172887.1 hypothetical protein [Lactobacillus kefiranofaciens]MCP9331516.1 hypothetical protein [Lactobacillus kefiranofaciens]PAK97606.1 hypothetical protein B8W86_09105 [Lactobacillus kefiranofaciens]QFQ67608.1 hypothetical protein LKK75_03780 [Lactobacillus kefiranofaciens subsp. kefiranofaciens]QNT44792.1 hypothetical protein ICI50_03715 [Lactobacillus kefiranofaciens]
MRKEKRVKLVELLAFFKDINFEKCVNGITIYCSNLDKLVEILNFLGGMGAYFNIIYESTEKDFIDKEKYAITVIDYDCDFEKHEQHFI